MTEIGFAKKETKEELKALWLRCFDDIPEAVDLFLNTWFAPDACVQATEDGRVVSALFLLPARIQGDGRMDQAHYIYGAGTLPEYRGRGFMGKLLRFADGAAARFRGDRYSFLLPENPGLYEFYRGAGYREGFYTRMVQVDRSELISLARQGKYEALSLDEPDWELRQKYYSKQVGSVQWGRDVVEYASAINRMYQGRKISGPWGYVLYRGSETAEVLEWMPRQEDAYLLWELLKSCGARRFCFRLPAESGFLQGKGEMIRFGMIKSLSNEPKMETIGVQFPYLGLTLD
ncbi:MAG: GNAT family N-acetyltransferase [Clostridiales bacterium]|jgi:predicted acetyltransferase|nr:GNAT family N-acetyltransferase [Clostridiales bacterium]